jgi:hypothetical protein
MPYAQVGATEEEEEEEDIVDIMLKEYPISDNRFTTLAYKQIYECYNGMWKLKGRNGS